MATDRPAGASPTHLAALQLGWGSVGYRFRESLFALPALIVAVGAVVAEGVGVLDRRLVSDPPPWAGEVSTVTAQWLLSTVAGATITTAGVVFSLTVVSLQLASSQFSPRVMRSFIRDRLSQVVIGALVATFVHCILTLRRLPGDQAAPAPPLGVAVAVVLALTTVLLIVAHLDHLARRLQVGELVGAIAHEGVEMLASVRRSVRAEQPLTGPVPTPHDEVVVRSPVDGWVTAALGDRMLQAVPPGTTVRVETRTGAYIHAGEPLVTVWPADERTRRRVRGLASTVGVASSRTMQEDVDFAIRQLVDIGLRALSPAVNDPTTAVEVVLRLGGLLRRLLVSDLPAEAVAGPGGRVLLRPWNLRHEEYLDHALEQLRHSGADQPLVMAALLRVLRMLIVHVEEQDRPQLVAPLQQHLALVREAARTGRGVQQADLDRLDQIAAAPTDPADHTPHLQTEAEPDPSDRDRERGRRR